MLPISNSDLVTDLFKKLIQNDAIQIIDRFVETIRFPTISAPDTFSLEPFHRMREYSTKAREVVFNELSWDVLGEGGIASLHSIDESISIHDYLNCVLFYARYISEIT